MVSEETLTVDFVEGLLYVTVFFLSCYFPGLLFIFCFQLFIMSLGLPGWLSGKRIRPPMQEMQV